MCVYVSVYTCMCVGMYICMCVYTEIYIYTYIYKIRQECFSQSPQEDFSSAKSEKYAHVCTNHRQRRQAGVNTIVYQWKFILRVRTLVPWTHCSPIRNQNRIPLPSGSQSEVHGPTLSAPHMNLSEKHILRLHPKPTDSEKLKIGLHKLSFNKNFWCFWCTLKFETHYSTI